VAAFAPAAIRACFDEVRRVVPNAQLSGILAHKPGYHNSRRNNSSSNYSVQRARDRTGNADAASALDITLNSANMALLTQRLITATRNRDPRMRGCRSFFGTVDGRTVTGLDVTDNRWITSDPSHLWHIHISGYRDSATNERAWLDIASVMTGRPAPPPTPAPPAEDPPTPAPPPPPRGIMTNHSASAHSNAVNLTQGRWTQLRLTAGGAMSFVNGPCRAQALVHLAFTGLRAGAAVHVRFYTVDIQTNGNGARRVTHYPVVEINGSAGSSAGQALCFAAIGRPAAGWTRRLRAEVAPEHAGIQCVRVRAETFWV
jgi:hypothetical protein